MLKAKALQSNGGCEFSFAIPRCPALWVTHPLQTKPAARPPDEISRNRGAAEIAK